MDVFRVDASLHLKSGEKDDQKYFCNHCHNLKTSLWCISYNFLKIWNSDQLPEQVYQPLGTQDDCATVLDNYPQVMIEIHHGGKPFMVIDEALLLGMGP